MNRAKNFGSLVHTFAEYTFSTNDSVLPGEFDQVVRFKRDYPNLRRVECEYNVNKGKLRGRIDAIFENKGKYVIVDFKTGRIDVDSPTKCTGVLSHLSDCSYMRTVVQLNLYRYLVPEKYSNAEMWLVHIMADSYQVMKIPVLKSEVNVILSDLEKDHTVSAVLDKYFHLYSRVKIEVPHARKNTSSSFSLWTMVKKCIGKLWFF